MLFALEYECIIYYFSFQDNHFVKRQNGIRHDRKNMSSF